MTQLENGTVTVPDLYDIVGDRSGDPENECKLCNLTLVLDVIKSICVVVDLYDIVLVDPVYGTVGTAAYLLASFHGNLPVGLLDREHLRKSGHFKYSVDVGIDVNDLNCVA